MTQRKADFVPALPCARAIRYKTPLNERDPMYDAPIDCGSSGPDLSGAVTVFVTTVGAPTFAACMEHLQAQDSRFALRVIEYVAPMDLAFQRMMEECRTPYYVQVDEDMLLYRHAVRTLHERIEAAGPRTAVYMANLHDAHLRRCIFGVKIFRHEIVRRYPFAPVDSFEVQQVARMQADGYTVVRAPVGTEPDGETLGRHGTHWTLTSIYERYTGLERRRQTDAPSLRWFGAYAPEFLERFLQHPSEENFFALMGVIAGRLASRNGRAAAKDYRTYGALPGFHELRQFLAAFEPPRAASRRASNRRAPRKRTNVARKRSTADRSRNSST
jgi:hypothetical protein